MAGMTHSEAKQFAHELTEEVSAVVAGLRTTNWNLPCFPKETWNPLTIGVPWESFTVATGLIKGQSLEQETVGLCSNPAHMDNAISSSGQETDLWGGSLLVAIGKLLAEVEQELIVVAPFWRTDGVDALLSAAGRTDYTGVTVRILTQPHTWMKREDKEGVRRFVCVLESKGATVTLRAPKPSDEGSQPIVHAKLLLADGISVYVGSANFTRSGLHFGIEVGVLSKGNVAQSFRSWFEAVDAACEVW